MFRRTLGRVDGTRLLAVAVLSTAVLAGCSSNNTSNTSSGKEASVAPSATTASSTANATPKAPVELKWLFRGGMLENAEALAYVNQKFNAVIKPTVVPAADYVNKQQLMLSSGDVPDVMLVLDPNTLKKYADQGLLAEVPVDTIAKYAPKVKAALDKDAPQGWFYSAQGGKNYGLTTLYTGNYTTPVEWRTDLLEKAGITKVPATIDEMTAAFEALKKINVYGMNTNGNSYYAAFQKIFGAYGVMPTQWMLKDGKIVNGAVVPEAKEALTLLADWYKKGYIDPEFITGKDLGTKFIDGKYAFNDNGSVFDLDETNAKSAIAAIKKVSPQGKLAFGTMPKGPTGKMSGWSWGTAGSIYVFGKQLEKQPEKLQKALEIMESAITDEETYVRLAYGVKGKHWDFANGQNLDDGVKQLSPYDDTAKLQAEGIAFGQTFFGGVARLDLNGKYTGKKVTDISEAYGKPAQWDVFGKSDILPSSGKYWGDLTKLKTETYAKIIRGDLPITAFDSFVKQWNDMGGAQLEKEANDLYNSLHK